jgi:hypothetical protein
VLRLAQLHAPKTFNPRCSGLCTSLGQAICPHKCSQNQNAGKADYTGEAKVANRLYGIV